MTDITYEDIYSLKADQLQKLLNKLMCAECCKHHITRSEIRLTPSDRIAIKDGGADIILETQKVINSQYFFSNKIIFQVKAEKLTSLKKELKKEEVKNFIKNGGAYILFCNKYSSEGFHFINLENKLKKEISKNLKINIKNVQFKLYDYSIIRDWIEDTPTVKVWFLELRNKGYGIFQSFERWAENSHMMTTLKSNDTLEQELKYVTQFIKEEKVLRIEGQAGIGKTRRIFEIIKREDLFRHNILYTDNVERKESEILKEINKWINLKQNVIIILDDCPLDIYERAKDLILNSYNDIKLISIDYVSSGSKSPWERGKYVSLSMVGEDIIQEILKEYYPDMETDDLAKLAKLCSYNPRMAEILGSYSNTDQKIDFSSCIPEKIINRMSKRHVGDTESNVITRLLEVFSLFDRIEYDGKNDIELLELAKLAKIDTDQVLKYFYILSNQLKVIQSRYGYHFVIPKILAIQMALNWCHTVLASVRSKLLNALPDNMKQALLRQLSNINNHKEIQDIAEEIAETFSDREVLNTSFGSECFYQLSIINPSITLKLLQKTFLDYTQQDYLEIKEGRRNIVRSLLVMAFHKELFLDAAEILLNLADAENENWGNNATGEFCEFFKLYLGGTQLPAIDRLKVIKDAMAEDNINKKEICLKALDNGLQVSSFTRMGGPEQQGAVILKDWQPTTYGDMWNYIGEIFEILEAEFSKQDSPFVQKIKDIVGKNLRSLIANGYFNAIEQSLARMFNSDRNGWETARVAFNHLREFEIKTGKINPLIVPKIEQLEHMLDATNLLEEIKFKLLSVHSWDLYGEEKDNIKDRILYYAKELQKHYDTLKSLLSDFGKSDNTNVFSLGKALVNELREKQLNEIITLSVEQLKTKKINSSGDASFLAGIFSGLDETGKHNVIFSFFEKWLKDETLAPWIILISRGMKQNTKLYQYWIKIIKEYKLSDFIYRCIPTAGAESYIGEFRDISLLLDALEQVATQGAIRAIIQSLHYCWLINKGIPAELRPQAQKIINNIELLSQMGGGYNSVHEYECTEIWESLYQTENEEIKSQSICSLIETMLNKKYKDTFVHQYAIGIIKKCLESGDSIALREVGKYLSEYDDVLVWLEIYLSCHFDSKQMSWVSNYNIKEIEKFMSMNENCSRFIARSVALFDKNDKMNPYFKYILEHFADNPKILEELYFNICNFSWVGPIGDYYSKVKNIIVPYLDDKNVNLRSWANGLVEEFDGKIKDSDKREELMQMGIYR